MDTLYGILTAIIAADTVLALDDCFYATAQLPDPDKTCATLAIQAHPHYEAMIEQWIKEMERDDFARNAA